jgi:hypothetical protein
MIRITVPYDAGIIMESPVLGTRLVKTFTSYKEHILLFRISCSFKDYATSVLAPRPFRFVRTSESYISVPIFNAR